MDEFVWEKIYALCPINLFDLKVIPTLNIERDRVHTLMHDVSRSVCTYDSTHNLDVSSTICEYAHISTR